jgi:hypothetical protein
MGVLFTIVPAALWVMRSTTSDGALVPGLIVVFNSWRRMGISVWADAQYAREDIYAFDTHFQSKPTRLRTSRDT